MKYLHICFSLLLLSCDLFGQMGAPSTRSAEQDLSAARLDIRQLDAFGERGSQKWQEFIELGYWVSQPGLDSTMLEELKATWASFFYLQEHIAPFGSLPWVKSKVVQSGTWKTKSSNAFRKLISWSGPEGQGTTEIWLVRTDKQFGNQTERVWQVFLGEIRVE
ncbi:MAG: hypothetical protein AAGI38_05045 [Bacteroidota bacterium]